MNSISEINSELQTLQNRLDQWCDFLRSEGHSNFADNFQFALARLNQQFTGDAKSKYMALLSFQDVFQGGMGSVNDVAQNSPDLRQHVEKERDRLVDHYYKILYP